MHGTLIVSLSISLISIYPKQLTGQVQRSPREGKKKKKDQLKARKVFFFLFFLISKRNFIKDKGFNKNKKHKGLTTDIYTYMC
jgi:hypothetical protein